MWGVRVCPLLRFPAAPSPLAGPQGPAAALQPQRPALHRLVVRHRAAAAAALRRPLAGGRADGAARGPVAAATVRPLPSVRGNRHRPQPPSEGSGQIWATPEKKNPKNSPGRPHTLCSTPNRTILNNFWLFESTPMSEAGVSSLRGIDFPPDRGAHPAGW